MFIREGCCIVHAMEAMVDMSTVVLQVLCKPSLLLSDPSPGAALLQHINHFTLSLKEGRRVPRVREKLRLARAS